MKKKLVVFIAALVMVFSCALGLVACGDSFEEGTYVPYMLVEAGDQKIAVEIDDKGFDLKGGKVTSGDKELGTYKVDGDKLSITIEDETKVFTQKDNYWYGTVDGMKVGYIKKGSIPKGYEVKSYEDLGDFDF